MILLEKAFDVTIPVTNVINFCADMRPHAEQYVRDNYVGRSFKGSFIVQLKEVMKMSSCFIDTKNTSGDGYIHLQFLAEVVEIGSWDILVGVRIVAQVPLIGLYKASSPELEKVMPQVVVTFVPTRSIEPVSVEQLVSVRVSYVLYPPMQERVILVGTLLTCDQMAPVYRLRGHIDPAAAIEYDQLLGLIRAELERREALIRAQKAKVWLFESLLYTYRRAGEAPEQVLPSWKDAPPWVGPEGLPPEKNAEMRNVLEVASRVVAGETVSVNGYWSRPLSVHRSSPLVALAPKAPPEWQPALEGEPRIAFAGFLKNILDFLAAVREMVELYDTPEQIERHFSLWKTMRTAQRDA